MGERVGDDLVKMFKLNFANAKNQKITKNITYLIIDQIKNYYYYYIFALISLYLTHESQSRLPFLAKELGELVHKNQLNEISITKFLVIGLFIMLFRTLSRILFFHPARLLERDLRVDMMKILEKSHPKRYEKYGTGQIFQIIQNDLSWIRTLVGFGLLQVGNIIMAILVLTPKLLNVDPKLIYSLSPLLVGVIIFGFLVSKYGKFFKNSMEKQGKIQSYLIESFEAKDTIKNFHKENSFKDLFYKLSFDELGTYFYASRGRAMASPIIDFSMGMSIILAAHFIYIDPNMGIEHIILFSGFSYLLRTPLMFLSWIGVVFTQAYGSWERIKELHYDQFIETPFEKETKQKSYSLWDHEIAIDENLINDHKWICFVGSTGVGKSTLLQKIATKLKYQNKTVSMVYQNPYLYSDTIEKNLFLGHHPTDEEKLKALHYLYLFKLNELSTDKANLLSIEVGENGKLLSGGQKKRLLLVRTILSDCEYLLWDDPFSSIDLVLEKNIIHSLKNDPNLQNKHFILTTHRYSTVKTCDYIFLLGKNQGIREQGKTRELFSKKGEVFQFFEGQMDQSSLS